MYPNTDYAYNFKFRTKNAFYIRIEPIVQGSHDYGYEVDVGEAIHIEYTDSETQNTIQLFGYVMGIIPPFNEYEAGFIMVKPDESNNVLSIPILDITNLTPDWPFGDSPTA